MLKIKKPTKKAIIIGIIAVGVIAAGALTYYFVNVRDDNPQTTGTTNGQEEPVNLAPPTEQDAQRVEDNKQQIVDRQAQLDAQSQQSDSSKKNVVPTITYAGQYGQVVEVGAEVAVFDASGTCTATFSLGASSFTKSVQAVQNVNRMNCPTISVPVSEFTPKGSWGVTIKYDSGSSTGVSNSSTIRVE